MPPRLHPRELDLAPHRPIDIDHLFLVNTVDVLVVVDGSISVGPGVGFGVGRVVELLRDTQIGCNRFSVDVAQRSPGPLTDHGASTTPGHIRYTNFAFDDGDIIDGYDEILMFGYNGEAGGNPVDGAELAAITAWMDDGGGVFATGDHADLGAEMCMNIPRVRSMRRWTDAQDVPSGGGTDRIDTNQPATPGQQAGIDEIPGSVQGDGTPQPIEWVAVHGHRHGLWQYREPHEILCHPTHGPIDVMPDHPHEGVCYEEHLIPNPGDFPGGVDAQVIAWGDVVPDPPYRQDKGDVDDRHFPMISVWDGRETGGGHGRVVVDSTWHHWMNMNLVGLEAAGGDDWDKIARYFVNVARWIAPAGRWRTWCISDILVAHFQYVGFEEFRMARNRIELGVALHRHLVHLHGPCSVRSLVFVHVCDLIPEICDGLRRRFRLPRPDPCLTCPPIEFLEWAVLGAMVEATLPFAEKIRAAAEQGERIQLSFEEIEREIEARVVDAVAELSQEIVESAKETADLFGRAIGQRAS